MTVVSHEKEYLRLILAAKIAYDVYAAVCYLAGVVKWQALLGSGAPRSV